MSLSLLSLRRLPLSSAALRLRPPLSVSRLRYLTVSRCYRTKKKPDDADDPPATPKKRGRPRLNPVEPAAAKRNEKKATEVEKIEKAVVEETKRPRGRPKKAQKEEVVVEEDANKRTVRKEDKGGKGISTTADVEKVSDVVESVDVEGKQAEIRTESTKKEPSKMGEKSSKEDDKEIPIATVTEGIKRLQQEQRDAAAETTLPPPLPTPATVPEVAEEAKGLDAKTPITKTPKISTEAKPSDDALVSALKTAFEEVPETTVISEVAKTSSASETEGITWTETLHRIPGRTDMELKILLPSHHTPTSPITLLLTSPTPLTTPPQLLARHLNTALIIPHLTPLASPVTSTVFPPTLHYASLALTTTHILFPSSPIGLFATTLSASLALSLTLTSTSPPIAAVAVINPIVDLYSLGLPIWDGVTNRWVPPHSLPAEEAAVWEERERIFGPDPRNWSDPFASPLFFFRTPRVEMIPGEDVKRSGRRYFRAPPTLLAAKIGVAYVAPEQHHHHHHGKEKGKREEKEDEVGVGGVHDTPALATEEFLRALSRQWHIQAVEAWNMHPASFPGWGKKELGRKLADEMVFGVDMAGIEDGGVGEMAEWLGRTLGDIAAAREKLPAGINPEALSKGTEQDQDVVAAILESERHADREKEAEVEAEEQTEREEYDEADLRIGWKEDIEAQQEKADSGKVGGKYDEWAELKTQMSLWERDRKEALREVKRIEEEGLREKELQQMAEEWDMEDEQEGGKGKGRKERGGGVVVMSGEERRKGRKGGKKVDEGPLKNEDPEVWWNIVS